MSEGKIKIDSTMLTQGVINSLLRHGYPIVSTEDTIILVDTLLNKLDALEAQIIFNEESECHGCENTFGLRNIVQKRFEN